jgi:hypothetical protein
MGVYGSVIAIAAVLEIVAGVRAYQFRNRGLVMTSLIAGLIPVLSCYCAPTAIAMTIYGLMVMFNAQVIAAFQMSKNGLTGNQILAAVYQSRLQ